MSDSLASTKGRLGAFVQHSLYSATETTSRARATFLAGFERRVDPTGILPPKERARRARAALKAHMTRLALRSMQVRRGRQNGEGQ